MGAGLILGLIGLGFIGAKIIKENLEPIKEYTPPVKPKTTESQFSEAKYYNGKLVIDDYYQYKQDWQKFGILQAQQWAEQGKYNMPEGQYRDAHSPKIQYVVDYEPKEEGIENE